MSPHPTPPFISLPFSFHNIRHKLFCHLGYCIGLCLQRTDIFIYVEFLCQEINDFVTDVALVIISSYLSLSLRPFSVVYVLFCTIKIIFVLSFFLYFLVRFFLSICFVLYNFIILNAKKSFFFFATAYSVVDLTVIGRYHN